MNGSLYEEPCLFSIPPLTCFSEPSLEAAQSRKKTEPHNKGGEEKKGRKARKDRGHYCCYWKQKKKKKDLRRELGYLTSTTTYTLILAGVFENSAQIALKHGARLDEKEKAAENGNNVPLVVTSVPEAATRAES